MYSLEKRIKIEKVEEKYMEVILQIRYILFHRFSIRLRQINRTLYCHFNSR